MKIDKNIDKFCENCGKKLIIKSNRDIIKKRFCSRFCTGQFTTNENWKNVDYRKKQTERLQSFSDDINKKKGLPGKLHPNWIENRDTLKYRRCYTEERNFFKEILKDRNYECELTGQKGGKLSVHHIDSVHLFPEKQFDKNNVVVIKKEIHLDFHRRYGFQWANKQKWNNFLQERIGAKR